MGLGTSFYVGGGAIARARAVLGVSARAAISSIALQGAAGAIKARGRAPERTLGTRVTLYSD